MSQTMVGLLDLPAGCDELATVLARSFSTVTPVFCALTRGGEGTGRAALGLWVRAVDGVYPGYHLLRNWLRASNQEDFPHPPASALDRTYSPQCSYIEVSIVSCSSEDAKRLLRDVFVEHPEEVEPISGGQWFRTSRQKLYTLRRSPQHSEHEFRLFYKVTFEHDPEVRAYQLSVPGASTSLVVRAPALLGADAFEMLTGEALSGDALPLVVDAVVVLHRMYEFAAEYFPRRVRPTSPFSDAALDQAFARSLPARSYKRWHQSLLVGSATPQPQTLEEALGTLWPGPDERKRREVHLENRVWRAFEYFSLHFPKGPHGLVSPVVWRRPMV
ncbi:hypothetical protein JCM11491_005385 [Sporobolomyces phaffii]